jgi:hypothetical protein
MADYYTCNEYGECYSSRWNSWGRWVFLAFMIIGFIVLISMCLYGVSSRIFYLTQNTDRVLEPSALVDAVIQDSGQWSVQPGLLQKTDILPITAIGQAVLSPGRRALQATILLSKPRMRMETITLRLHTHRMRSLRAPPPQTPIMLLLQGLHRAMPGPMKWKPSTVVTGTYPSPVHRHRRFL